MLCSAIWAFVVLRLVLVLLVVAAIAVAVVASSASVGTQQEAGLKSSRNSLELPKTGSPAAEPKPSVMLLLLLLVLSSLLLQQ